jgi:tetratricopeptide (TPR) repeat protein
MHRLSWISLVYVIVGSILLFGRGPASLTPTAYAGEVSWPASNDTTTRASMAPRLVNPSPTEWDALNLGRAVDLWLGGDLRGAAELLETIDISPTSSFDRADRAAFLLAVAYLNLDDPRAFHSVARRSADEGDSAFRRWIRFCQLVESAKGGSSEADVALRLPADLPGAGVLGAALLLEAARPHEALRLLESTKPEDAMASIHFYLRALAGEASGSDPTKDWERVAKMKPRNAHEADLVATALLRLVAARLQNGGDAADLLKRVPRESRHAPRASHVRALDALETGDTEKARELFSNILEESSTYESRREVELALGGLTMDRAQWSAALIHFESADIDWNNEYQSLDQLENDATLPDVWQTWEWQQFWREEIRLAPEALLADLADLAEASLDLRLEPSLEPSKHMGEDLWPEKPRSEAPPQGMLSRHYPQPGEWQALRAVQQRRRLANSALAEQDRIVAAQRRDLERRLGYLLIGRHRATQSADDLADSVTRLANILARLDTAVRQMEAVRDSTLRRIAIRTRAMVEGIRRERLFIRAVRHFHVDGPKRERPEEFPAGVHSPSELLSMEDSLAMETERFLVFFGEHSDSVIARSFAEIWEPRLTGGSRQLHQAMLAELDRARRVGSALDSTLAWYNGDPQGLAAAIARRDELAAAVDSLRSVEENLRRQIAHAVATRGREQLQIEREAVDYHVADAAYELAVQLATDPETAEDTVLVAPARDRAIAHLSTFLTRYPESLARGEGRFRLADLRLMQARDDFRGKMAQFLGEEPSANELEDRSLAPFVDYTPPIALYEAILAEDPDFPHLDAVLFNLGMILSDDGQPTAAGYLTRLVGEYPESPDCQEAWLRMGNDRFDRKDFAGCISLFEEAVAGQDPSFTAIALYKLGWAHFEEDRFDNSADAFRRLMDLYTAHEELAADMDLRDEAEEYLVHSLARSGGADAFRTYFDNLGGRVYETRVLISLGYMMRSVSLYEEAVACEELWLDRYPLHPQALAVAERLVDTYRSWNKTDAAREAKLAQADRFLPDSQWFRANKDDAAQAAGLRFAQSAYREAAAHHHFRARQNDDAASWRSALTNYERYLMYWPNADDAPRIHFLAGETANRLGSYSSAFAHFTMAAKSDSTTLATDAAWQVVSVSDSWYRSSRPTGTDNGTDSLAVVLLNAGSQFVEHFPRDNRCADIIWRQGNVAYAHGWFDDASANLSLFGERYPNDSRAPTALRMSGDAHYQRADFASAGECYENALELATVAGEDSLVAALRATIPRCYFKYAESVATVDRKNGDKEAAPLFARLAQRWPDFEHTDLALYRAGLGFAAGNSYADAAASWEALLADHPDSDYARDAAIEIARVHKKGGNKRSAASAYERFSALYRDDPDAPSALLKAADLLADAKDGRGAEQMRTLFIARFPGEVETVMEIRAERAERELAKVTAGAATLSSLFAASSQVGAGDGTVTEVSQLKAYMALAAQNPELASPVILAQVDYFKAEESYAAYASLRLTQPLPSAIEHKQKKLTELLDMYDRCTRQGVTEYSRASAHRIGQALIHFGDALVASERPKGLSEDDLLAYDEVLEEQAWEFFDRGEDVWSELLQQTRDAKEDPGQWIARTREALWPRLAWRFLYRPELDYPLVAAVPPGESNAN